MSAIAIVAFGFQYRMTFGVTLLLMAMVVTASMNWLSCRRVHQRFCREIRGAKKPFRHRGTEFLISELRDIHATWTAPGSGDVRLEVDRLMLELGGHLRAGLEEYQV